jgi:hypothetical protein
VSTAMFVQIPVEHQQPLSNVTILDIHTKVFWLAIEVLKLFCSLTVYDVKRVDMTLVIRLVKR